METTPKTKQRPYQMFAVGDYERVIAHGTRQLQRGRRPSMAFGETRDPRLALRAAMRAALSEHNGLLLSPMSIIAASDGLGRISKVLGEFDAIRPNTLTKFFVSGTGDFPRMWPTIIQVTQAVRSYHPNSFRPDPDEVVYFEGRALRGVLDDVVFGYALAGTNDAVIVPHHPHSEVVAKEFQRQIDEAHADE